MDTVFCGHCKREQKLEDAAGSAVCTCKRCGALLQGEMLTQTYHHHLVFFKWLVANHSFKD